MWIFASHASVHKVLSLGVWRELSGTSFSQHVWSWIQFLVHKNGLYFGAFWIFYLEFKAALCVYSLEHCCTALLYFLCTLIFPTALRGKVAVLQIRKLTSLQGIGQLLTHMVTEWDSIGASIGQPSFRASTWKSLFVGQAFHPMSQLGSCLPDFAWLKMLL